MVRYIIAIAAWALLYKPIIAQTPSPTQPSASPPAANGTTITPAPAWPTASFPTFPPEFNDIPKETLECWESWANYKLRARAPNPGIISSSRTTTWRTTHPTPIYSTWISPIVGMTNHTKVPIGLTTLCDGYPRASSGSYIKNWSTSYINTTYTLSTEFFHSTVPGITKSGYEVVVPTCTVAPNDSPLCDRVISAYSWWATSQASPTPIPDRPEGNLAIPTCWQLVEPPPDAKPTCQIHFKSHDIYYWPTPAPTGAAFCNSSWIAPTGTPTIPGKPNTAVVSGLTLTSPSVYHFFHSVNFETFAGTKRRADSSWIPTTNVLRPYTMTSGLGIYTYSELESDMVSVTDNYNRRARATTYVYNNDFLINDVYTIRADKWYGNNTRRPRNSTIFQDESQPHLAVSPKELAKQNKILEDCEWARGYTYMRLGVPIMNTLSQERFHPIMTTEGGAPPSPSSSAQVSPGPVPVSSPTITTVATGAASSKTDTFS